MLALQSIYGGENLLDLIGFRHSAVILNVDAWVARPRHPVDSVTASFLPMLPKIVLAYLAQIREPHIFRVLPHPTEDSLDALSHNDTNNDTKIKRFSVILLMK